MSSIDIYYVYIYKDPATFEPFYIGKGKGNRFKTHLRNKTRDPNKLKQNVIAQIRAKNQEPIIEFYAKELSEADAHLLEISLIAKYGRRDIGTGILCNLTDGGEGTTNKHQYIRTDAHKNALKLARENSCWFYSSSLDKEIWCDPKEVPEGFTRGRRPVGKWSKENNPMFGSCRTGDLNPMYGKTHSELARQKISEAANVPVCCIHCKMEMGAKKFAYHLKKYQDQFQ